MRCWRLSLQKCVVQFGLNLVDAPQHVVFFKHVSNDELFVSIDHQNHAIGLRSIGEDEGMLVGGGGRNTTVCTRSHSVQRTLKSAPSPTFFS